MHKFTALALTAALGIAATGFTKPAEAGVYVGVGLPVPAVAPVVAYPPGVYAPYYYGYGAPYYYGPGFVGFGYRGPAFGFRGPGVGFRGPGVGFRGPGVGYRGAGFARGFRR